MKLPVSRRSPALLVLVALALSAPVVRAQTFDHGPFDALLRAHVVDGLVDYDAFRRAPDFARYLESLGAQDPTRLPRDEQLAFWINAYNAYTIQLIVKHDEHRSIRNINTSFGLKRKGPWGEPLARVGGRSYTLDDIEHTIIRPRYREPRIHFALVCAAIGCPPLRPEAYTGDRLEVQLEDQGAVFIARSPAKNRVDVASRTLHHSMIFDWYKDDFGGSVREAGRYMGRWFAEGSPERALLLSGRFKTKGTEYDWALNVRGNWASSTK